MMHKTVIEADPPEMLTRRSTEAIVHLYRRSQAAGDEGRIFIMRWRRMFPPFELQIGLARTNDWQEIASILQWRDISHDDIREVDEHEILAMIMTDEDKAASHRHMRRRLYFNYKLINSLDASDRECAAALRTIPDIDQIEVLWRVVRSDGIWAAQQVLSDPYTVSV